MSRATKLKTSLLYTHEGEVGEDTELSQTSLVAENPVNGKAISLNQCQLTRTRILVATGSRMTSCEVETVDAANAEMDNSGWRDVLVHESRLTGARMNFSSFIRTTFEGCQMNHVQMQECTFKNSRFDQCDLRNAFFNGSQMNGTVFEGSNLAGADFSRADISKCDLRRANIEDIRISPDQLRGVIVTADQALYLARLLGLDVRE